MNEPGNISVYNPDKQISEQVTLKAIVRHNTALRLAMNGFPEMWEGSPPTNNEKINFQFQGIKDMIAEQQILTDIAKPIIKLNCINKWKKKNKKDEEREENPFDEDENDYNELRGIALFIEECEQRIIEAKRTKKLDDDFIWEKTDQNGEVTLELTNNFFTLRNELRESYESIYSLLLKHKIVTAGIEEDEEMTYKQKEEEAIRRVVEA